MVKAAKRKRKMTRQYARKIFYSPFKYIGMSWPGSREEKMGMLSIDKFSTVFLDANLEWETFIC